MTLLTVYKVRIEWIPQFEELHLWNDPAHSLQSKNRMDYAIGGTSSMQISFPKTGHDFSLV